MTNYTTYKEMARQLERLAPFTGNSVSAHLGKSAYVVKSYNTVIFALSPATGEIAFNNLKFSSTTSRLQNILKEVFCLKDCQECKFYVQIIGALASKYKGRYEE